MQDVLIYCGVYKGRNFYRLLKKHHFDLVYGFEPIPGLYKALCNNHKHDDHIHFIKAVLGPKAGRTSFYIYNRDASSSCGPISDEWISHWKKRKGQTLKVKKKIDVKVLNLFEWCQNNQIERIKYLVTDLQGMDFAVLSTVLPMLKDGLIDIVKCEIEHDNAPSAYPTLPPNKQHQFLELFRNLPYKLIEGSEKKWSLKKQGTHMDMAWKVEK